MGHMRKHNGPTFFVCENKGCGKTFMKNADLKKHQKSQCASMPKPKHDLYNSIDELDEIVQKYSSKTKLIKVNPSEESYCCESTEVHSQSPKSANHHAAHEVKCV